MDRIHRREPTHLPRLVVDQEGALRLVSGEGAVVDRRLDDQPRLTPSLVVAHVLVFHPIDSRVEHSPTETVVAVYEHRIAIWMVEDLKELNQMLPIRHLGRGNVHVSSALDLANGGRDLLLMVLIRDLVPEIDHGLDLVIDNKFSERAGLDRSGLIDLVLSNHTEVVVDVSVP